MFRKIIFILILVIGTTAGSLAQEIKIAYVNIEAVLLYMPETKAMNQSLQTYQTQLAKKLQTKQEYAQTRFQEYQENASGLDEAGRKKLEEELMKLDEEIKKEQADAEQKLLQKRQELMDPILQRLDTNLKDLASAEEYDLILNSVDGNGVSIVLHGPAEDDLTEKLMSKLGISLPSSNN